MMDNLIMFAAEATGTSGLTTGLEELGKSLQSDVKGIIPTAVAVLGVSIGVPFAIRMFKKFTGAR
ncbi:hypothetical protein [Lactobacillus helveticus]|uniref:Uncharacterized protein n=1 Tax=Lactobacillus helveticus TaxID=1587 RepID=A0A6A7K373_LACHE|nr:hypothetical protein [Lactobacillus helveticus]MPW14916.1 hypothetical protein [Lactobacillus helveticus]